MPAPTFAIGRRGEQAIDDFRECIGRTIAEKFRHFVRRRRQAGEIERGAADQRPFVGRFDRCDAGGFLFRQNEGIDGRLEPGRVANLWQSRRDDRLKDRNLRSCGDGPPLRVEITAAPPGQALPSLIQVERIATSDSFSLDFGGIFSSPCCWMASITRLLSVPRHDGRPPIAAVDHRGPRIEPQAGFLLLRPMALIARRGQQRPDLLFEERGFLSRGLSRFG